MGFYSDLRKAGFKFASTPPAGPSYIMPDGQFLDITSSMDLIDSSGIMIPSHPAIDKWLFDNGKLDPAGEFNRALCQTDNAIRVNDGTNLLRELVVGLPPNLPSPAQFASLENWLYSVFSKGGVDVGVQNGSGEFKHYDFSQTLPEDVIDRIKRYYSSGRLLDAKRKSRRKSI